MIRSRLVLLALVLLPLLAACTVDTAKENLRSGPEVMDVTNLAATLPMRIMRNTELSVL